MLKIEGPKHRCPKCDNIMYFAAGQYRCSDGRCGFHTRCSDTKLWGAIVNLQGMLAALEGMLSLLPKMEAKHEGPPTNFYAEVLGDSEFFSFSDALDEK